MSTDTLLEACRYRFRKLDGVVAQARLSGCFVSGWTKGTRLLHLPAEVCVVLPTEGRSELVAETACGNTFSRAISHLVAPDHMELCDRCALADLVQFAVYRFFAADGTVLYVGQTCDVLTRLLRHGSTADPASWWPLVVDFSIEEYPTRAAALAAERAAIETECPVGNVRFKAA